MSESYRLEDSLLKDEETVLVEIKLSPQVFESNKSDELYMQTQQVFTWLQCARDIAWNNDGFYCLSPRSRTHSKQEAHVILPSSDRFQAWRKTMPEIPNALIECWYVESNIYMPVNFRA